MLLFASLLLMAGCGGGQGGAPAGTASATTASATTTTTERTNQEATLTIVNSAGDKVDVGVEIASTEQEREKGLMGRTTLAEDHGMLFVFGREQPLDFWMKDTLIPLSIAFIDSSGRIVDIQDMQPLDETLHRSAEPARYALEVNQGFFSDNGIEVGNKVILPAAILPER